MRLNSRSWFLLSLMLFVAAAYFWLRGNERRAANSSSGTSHESSGQRPTSSPAPARTNHALLTRAVTNQLTQANFGPTNPANGTVTLATAKSQNRFPYRLSNTRQSLEQLTRSDTAVLLRNALIDTASRTPLTIPDNLRTQTDPGSYVVQSRGPLTEAFRGQLRDAGAAIISYIPNNAYLVRVTEDGAKQLAALPQTQEVLPYQPYYKLDQELLALAMEKKSLPADGWLSVTVFPNERETALAAMKALGAEHIAEDRSPFGPQLIIRPAPDSLVALAGLSSVQEIETYHHRRLLNDLARERLAVSSDTVVKDNYLGLTGNNVLVNVNDSGVDRSHPDLAGRVFSTDTNSFTLLDLDGHGTHVGGIIASSGGQSATVTNASGSLTNADFRGKAPAARLFVLPVDLRTGPLISDEYLQETAARTNAFISNNSWAYIGANDYSTAAARYDEAVRDASPLTTGSQPILYVFAAGNDGFGEENGQGGIPSSIASPGTAKNVITVGASENLRRLTNSVISTNQTGTNITYVTNQIFFGLTDSIDEIASFSSRGNVGIGIEGEFGRFKPDVVAPGTFVVSTRSSKWTLDKRTPDFSVLNTLNNGLGKYYRYESGTSMAAPAVSGVLALMQEFFEQRLQRTNSPALMKALLINGARSLGHLYDFDTHANINYQGWGLVNITNSIPAALTNASAESSWPIRFFDQSPTNALITGQSHTWKLTLATNAQFFPLRVTLVWTDPPGNPAAAVKLVNDLDLIVTNLDSGEVFYGNNILSGSDFNQPLPTNSPPVSDVVNNVENIFLHEPLGANYSVTVSGRRINVNAVPENTTGVVQDYALVVSSGDGETSDAISAFTRQSTTPELRPITYVTNGVALLNQRVGANFPLTNSTIGTPNQWSFYVFTNTFLQTSFTTLTNGTNVGFITFLPPNLGRPRNLDADIDLYVSTNSALTNLDPVVIAAADKSTNRSGTQVVVFTNAPIGSVFYIGVKSEDQQSAEFGLVGLSSDVPFTQVDQFGNQFLRGFPVNVPIPDGSPEKPGAALVFAIGTFPINIARVIVTNIIQHESIGDLVGNLSHNDKFVVLNNHYSNDAITNHFLVYDDSNSGSYLNQARPTDGPGSLNNFAGDSGQGVWLLTMTDDAPNHTGRNVALNIRLEPNVPLTAGVAGTVLANRWSYYFVDVPPEATNLTVTLSQMSAPLDLYLRLGDLPTAIDYDKFGALNPPTGSVSIGMNDVPPLNAGRYYIGVFNPNAVTATFFLTVNIERSVRAELGQVFSSGDTPVRVKDNAISQSTILVNDARAVASLNVGVRVDHPRVSDLVLHLVSPGGKRVLLMENRGGLTTNGFGGGVILTNVSISSVAGGNAGQTNVIQTGQNSGSLTINYDFFGAPDTMRVYYEGARIFDSGNIGGAGTFLINYGPGLSTDVTITMNEGGSHFTAWQYTASVRSDSQLDYLTFTENLALANTLVKFSQPPYTNAVPTQITPLSNFEGATAGVYAAGQNLDGWSVVTNQSIVIADPSLAYDGANVLALANGQIQRTLPTVAGSSYDLTFAARGPGIVSWWPGEANANDIAGTNVAVLRNGVAFSTNGMVRRAFSFDGVDDYVSVNRSSTLDVGRSGGFTIECWINPSDVAVPRPLVEWNDTNGIVGVNFWLAVNAAGGGAGSLFADLVDTTNASHEISSPPGVLSASSFQHVAVTYDKKSGTAVLYLNGAAVATSALGSFTPSTSAEMFFGRRVLGPGSGTSYKGLMDEVSLYNRALTATEIRAIYGAGSAGKCSSPSCLPTVQIGLGGATNIISGGKDWIINTVSFAATQNGTSLQLSGNTLGMLFDTFRLTKSASTLYYLPEETLKTFDGESALGNWTLEIWDNRAGPVQPGTPQLLSWQLQLLLARASPPATRLTNGIPFFGTVGNNEIKYFVVDVPREAILATNTLAGAADLVLLYSSTGLPTGNLASDVVLDDFGPGGGEQLILNTNTPPQLRPGQRYYLGVTKVGTNASSAFALQVDFALTNSSLVVPIVLTNSVAYTNTIQVTNAIDYYQFTVSPYAYAVTFEVIPQNGNVDLLIRKGLPVPDPLPTPNQFDYSSAELGTARERIVVDTNSVPVALTRGVWYLGVYNVDATPVTYTVIVTEARNNFSVTQLTNGVPYVTSVDVASPLTNFFLFPITGTNVGARFDLYNLSGKADLLTQIDAFPAATSFFDRASATNAAGTRLFLPTAGQISANGDWLAEGAWYLWVQNKDVSTVNFTIRATLFTNGVPTITTLTDAVSRTSTLFGTPDAPDLDYYKFTVPATAKYVDFELFPGNGNVDLLLTRGPSLPTTNSFDYSSGNGGLTNEFIRVARGSLPVALTPGDWFLAVRNRENYPVTYSVRATATAVSGTINLVEGVAYPNVAVIGNPDFYRVTVVGNAVQAFFELSPNGAALAPVDMYLRRGLPLPSATLFSYRGSNVLAQKIILIGTNSTPAVLGVGDWYLSVTNNTATPVPYSIRFDQRTPVPRATNLIYPTVTLTNNSYCLSWPSPVGVDYHVEAKSNRLDASWIIASPTATAASTNASYCFSLPTPYHEFQIVLGALPPSPTNIVINPQPVVTNNSLCLTWGSQIGATYRVEGKITVVDPTWTAVSPSILATSTTTTYCVSLTNAQTFFRVIQLAGSVPTNTVPTLTATNVFMTTNGFTLRWTAPASQQFKVQFSTNLLNWLTFTNIVSSTTGNFSFTDDGSQTGGILSVLRFYRLLLFP